MVWLFVLILSTLLTSTRATYYQAPRESVVWGYFTPPILHGVRPASNQSELEAMVDLTNGLGVAILQDQSFSRGNFAFSPYGVASVLVVLYEGARGESAIQIQRSVGFPLDRDIMRVGFRDIHRHLRSYFSHEGYLSGISLNKDCSTLKTDYKRILRFYGYDIDLDDEDEDEEDPGYGPTKTPAPTASNDNMTAVTTTLSPTTKAVETTTTPSPTTKAVETITTPSSEEEIYERTGTPTANNSLTSTVAEITTQLPSTANSETEGKLSSTSTPTTVEEQNNSSTTSETTTASTLIMSETTEENMSTTAEITQNTTEENVTTSLPTKEENNIDKAETATSGSTTSEATEENIILTTELTNKTQEETTRPETEPDTDQLQPAELSDLDNRMLIPQLEETVTTTSLTSATSTPPPTISATSTPPPTTSATSTPPPTTSATSTPPPTTSATSTPPPTTSATSTRPPTTSATSTPPPTTSATSTPPPTTSATSTPPPTTSATSTPPPTTSATSTPPPTTTAATSTTPPTTVISTDTTITTEYSDKTLKTSERRSRVEAKNEIQIARKTDTSVIREIVNSKVRLWLNGHKNRPTTEATTTETESPNSPYWLNGHIVIPTEPTTGSKKYRRRSAKASKNTVETSENEGPNAPRWLNGPRVTSKSRKTRTITDYLKSPLISDMSLQLQNGMYDTHVSRNAELFRSLPRLLFLVDGAIDTPVPMMTYTHIFPYAYVPKLHSKALEFPLDDPRYKLLILLPVERRGLRQLIYDLMDYPLRNIFESLRPTKVRAMIPTFMVEGFVILTSSLQKLGIWDVFDPRKANLSGMSLDPELYVRNVEQSVTVVIRNYVEILDIQTRTIAGRFINQNFEATHPFLYFVLDTATNVSLMAGQILDPLNSRIY